MGYEHDPTISAMTATVQLLNEIATHRLIAQSDYPELKAIAESANQLVPPLVTAIGKLKAQRAPKRADD